jgi:tellurite resistance protein
MPSNGDSILIRVASSIATPHYAADAAGKSILLQAAASFGRRPTGAESTIPTGFDPRAATLFEAVVEAAFLVANSDGEFDERERQAFERVVTEACHGTLRAGDLHALVSDLLDLLREDGIERRVGMVAGAIVQHEHKLEVLRIAALMAHVSGGVQQAERQVLELLAGRFGLGADAVKGALEQAERALR